MNGLQRLPRIADRGPTEPLGSSRTARHGAAAGRRWRRLRRRGAAVAAAAALLACAGAAHAAVAVSNLEQTASGTITARFSTAIPAYAQAFTTGSADFSVTEVVLRMEVPEGTVMRVSLRSDSSGTPGSSLHVLTPPSIFDQDASTNDVFTSAGYTLAADTTYWVVVERESGSDQAKVNVVYSADEDGGGQSGWSIGDTFYRFAAASSSWGPSPLTFANPLLLSISGDVTPPQPMAGSAVVDGTTLTIAYDRALRATSPVDSAGQPVFDVAVTGGSAFTVSGVVAGVGPRRNKVAMTLDPSAQAGQTVTVSYRADDATRASSVQNEAGNPAASLDAMAVRNATTMDGAPAITVSNAYRVPALLGVDLSDITDSDGFGNLAATATYEWVRVDRGRGTVLRSGAANTYRLTRADAGKKIKVRVRFTDDANNPNTEYWLVFQGGTSSVSSTRYLGEDPGSAAGWRIEDRTERRYADSSGGFSHPPHSKRSTLMRVNGAVNPVRVCDASSTQEIWCATLLVAGFSSGGVDRLGFRHSPRHGGLSPNGFDWRGMTVRSNTLHLAADTTLTVDFERASGAAVPGDGLLGPGDFRLQLGAGGARQFFAINNPGVNRIFQFDGAGLSWSAGQSVPVRLLANRAATGEPAIEGTLAVSHTVRATVAGIADPGGVPGRFDYQWMRVDGGTPAEIHGATNATYTLTSDDVGKTIQVKVSFLDGDGFTEALTSPESATVADRTVPALTDAEVSLKTLTLTYDEDLDSNSTPAKEQFTVKTNGIAKSLASTGAVAVSGATVTLTLADVVHTGAVVTVSYAVPGTDPLQDVTGNDAEPFTDEVATNSTSDAVPELLSAAVNGTAVTLTYDESLDTSKVPARTAFGVRVVNADRALVTMNAVAINGTEVTLTLSSAAGFGEAVLVSYTQPSSNALQDSDGNLAESFTAVAATNRTPHPGGVRCTGAPEEIWCARVSVGSGDVAGDTEFGFISGSPGIGSLDVTGFSYSGTTYAVGRITYTSGTLSLSTTPAGAVFAGNDDFVLEIGDEPVNLSGATGGVLAISGLSLDAWASGDTVPVKLLSNRAATGTPEISGIAEFDKVLTAHPGTIADPDGVPTNFTYQWVRHPRGGSPADINDADARTYRVTLDDLEAQLSVKVGFIDDRGFPEQRSSDAYPSGETVSVPPAPRLGTATVNGEDILLTYNENLYAAEEPDVSAFTVTVDGTAVAPETSNPVRISGRELKLVLADTLAPGAGPVKVSYAATGGLLSARGGTAPGFTDQTVINITPGNATGPLKVKGIGGRPLADAVEASVPGPALGASFTQAPAAHDGSSAFELDFAFSGEPAGYSYKTVHKHLFDVTGGRIEKASRLVRGSNVGWKIRVAPDGGGAVTLAARATTDCAARYAACDANGLKFDGALSLTVPGPDTPAAQAAQAEPAALATVSIAAPASPVAEGTALVFALARSGATDAALAVNVAVSETGDALGTPPASVTFAAGSASAALSVPTVDDAAFEPASTVTARLTAGTGYTVDAAAGSAEGVVESEDLAPLTASFTQAPAEHDGSSVFEMRFAFDREPTPGYSYKTVHKHLFDVTGGRIEKASRAAPPSNRGWKLRVRPDGLGPVRLAARATTDCAARYAACDADGRMFDGKLAATVLGPPTLSVADAEIDEADGAALDFTVALSRAVGETVTVAYATSDGSATAGEDYRAVSGRLVFAANEVEKTVSVPVLNDPHDEGSETLTFTLADPRPARVKLADATATGTIANDDPMPRAWIARFGRSVAEQVLDAVEGRMRAARRPGAELRLAGERIGLRPQFVGRAAAVPGPAKAAGEAGEERADAPDSGTSDLAAWLRGGAPAAPGGRTRTMDASELLLGSSFSLAGNAGEGSVSFWGRGAVTRFDGSEGALALDLGGGLAFAVPGHGMRAELRGRGLLSHAAKGFRERGVSGSLYWQPGAAGRGPSLSLTQTLGGASAGGAGALLGRPTLAGLAGSGSGADDLGSRRLEARLGYGIAAFGERFTLTPELAAGLSDAGRAYSLSWRLERGAPATPGAALALSSELTRRESPADNARPEHRIGIRLDARF